MFNYTLTAATTEFCGLFSFSLNGWNTIKTSSWTPKKFKTIQMENII